MTEQQSARHRELAESRGVVRVTQTDLAGNRVAFAFYGRGGPAGVEVLEPNGDPVGPAQALQHLGRERELITRREAEVLDVAVAYARLELAPLRQIARAVGYAPNTLYRALEEARR